VLYALRFAYTLYTVPASKDPILFERTDRSREYPSLLRRGILQLPSTLSTRGDAEEPVNHHVGVRLCGGLKYHEVNARLPFCPPHFSAGVDMETLLRLPILNERIERFLGPKSIDLPPSPSSANSPSQPRMAPDISLELYRIHEFGSLILFEQPMVHTSPSLEHLFKFSVMYHHNQEVVDLAAPVTFSRDNRMISEERPV